MKQILLLCLLSIFFSGSLPGEVSSYNINSFKSLPTEFKGRIRPIDAYARLWLYDLYHFEEIKDEHRDLFHQTNESAQEFLWNIHFLGHEQWAKTPLFYIKSPALKSLLSLDGQQDRYALQELEQKIYSNPKTSTAFLTPFLIDGFIKAYSDSSNRSKSEKIELAKMAAGLWVMFHGDDIVIAAVPQTSPWNQFKKGSVLIQEGRQLIGSKPQLNAGTTEEGMKLLSSLSLISQLRGVDANTNKILETAILELQDQGISPKEIALILEEKYPLYQRLSQSDSLFKMLPSQRSDGEWLPLKALETQIYDPKTSTLVPVGNFTIYSDAHFEAIRSSYLALKDTVVKRQKDSINFLSQNLSQELQRAYLSIASKPYRESSGKALYYPTKGQLSSEVFYYEYPLTFFILVGYLSAFIFFCLGTKWPRWNQGGFGTFILTFILHTCVLGMRCYILNRPPVSNMFETIIYVPWISSSAGIMFYLIFRNPLILSISSFAAIILLAVLQMTHLSSSLENVQAVLDSQYWLIIHVLLVVGSYGAFILSGILGHFYLILTTFKPHAISSHLVSRWTLQSMYLGVAMLVPGTILGGVWAAESWGRFWDWDPKESWAFISICIYLIWIHAYRFQHIRDFGLAIGAVTGLLSISFTWYGVNYILGTGLHSYGFGSGGDGIYYLFLLSDIAFLLGVWWIYSSRKRLKV